MRKKTIVDRAYKIQLVKSTMQRFKIKRYI